MSRPLSPLHRFTGDQRGVAAVELGLIIVPFFILLMGGMEIGYQVYVRTVVAGALEAAARSTTVEDADSTAIEKALRNAVLRVMPKATVEIKTGSFYRYTQINAQERLTKDSNGNDVLDKGDCWEDVDDNDVRNTVTVGKEGIGGADDIVRYNVTASYHRLFPIYKYIGFGDTAYANSSILVKRQPYAGQTSPTIKCKIT